MVVSSNSSLSPWALTATASPDVINSLSPVLTILIATAWADNDGGDDVDDSNDEDDDDDYNDDIEDDIEDDIDTNVASDEHLVE